MHRFLVASFLIVLVSAAQAQQARLPLAFEQNGGRYEASARFVAPGPGWTLFVERDAFTLALRGETRAAVRTVLDGAAVEPEGELPRAGRVHHLLGDDPSRWSRDNPTFGRVRQAQVWPGIDLVLYGKDGRLEYDFHVAPGADPELIRMRVEGTSAPLTLAEDGDLLVETTAGTLRHEAPYLYQDGPAGRMQVAGRFVLLDADLFAFEIGDYDAARPLVIDPVLVWAGLLGGMKFEAITDLAVGADGSVFVCGWTESADLPTTPGAFDPSYNPPFTISDFADAFVARISGDGTELLWCTYFGGTDFTGASAKGTRAFALDLDEAGLPVFGGDTLAVDLPTSIGAFQPGKTPSTADRSGWVAKLSADGASLVWGTYLGGTGGSDEVHALRVGPDGGVHVAGTAREGFPVTPGAFQTELGPLIAGFAGKLSGDGATLAWCGYVGSLATPAGTSDFVGDLAVDALGRTYLVAVALNDSVPTTAGAFQLAGTDGNLPADLVLYRVSADGSTLEYGTYFGGSGTENGTGSWPGVDCDDEGRAWIVGGSSSHDLPVSPGAWQTTKPAGGGQNAFVACFDTDASGAASRLWATYFATSANSRLRDVEVDALGRAHVAGNGYAPWLNAFQSCAAGGLGDIIYAIFDATGDLEFATALGGSGNEQACCATSERGRLRVDAAGNAWLAGSSDSADLSFGPVFQPGLAGAAPGDSPQDAFIAKISPAPAMPASAVVRAPCVGVAPPGSLVPLSVGPHPGSTFQVGIGDPAGASGFTSGQTTWLVSLLPIGPHPCGVPVPGKGGNGATGELFINTTPGILVYQSPLQSWTSAAAVTVHDLPIPCWAFLNGVKLYTQGAILSGGKFVLTEGLDLTIGY